jgi:hypothetical protein
MKTINNKLIATCLLILLTFACTKKTPAPTTDTNGLPLATQTGKNTFGCLIDGEPVSVYGGYSWLYGNGVTFTMGDSLIFLEAITGDPRKDFYIKGTRDRTKAFTYNVNTYISSGYSSLNIEGGTASLGPGYFTTIDTLPASITITNFTGNGTTTQKGDIVSGTFDMVMQNSSGKKIHLTAGRFDIAR